MKINKYVHTGALWIPVFFCHPASPSSSRHLVNLVQTLISDLPLCWQPKWIPARWMAIGQYSACLQLFRHPASTLVFISGISFALAIALFIFYWTEWGDAGIWWGSFAFMFCKKCFCWLYRFLFLYFGWAEERNIISDPHWFWENSLQLSPNYLKKNESLPLPVSSAKSDHSAMLIFHSIPSHKPRENIKENFYFWVIIPRIFF